MDTIEIKIDYDGPINVGGEFQTAAPCVVTWFPKVDLLIETPDEKIIFNSDNYNSAGGVYTVALKNPDKNLELIQDVELKLVKNNVATFLIVNDKYAYKIKDFRL